MMKVIDFKQETFEMIRDKMDSNGYSHFNRDAYKAKNNTPCFIPEHGESIEDIESWNSLFKESLETIKTKDFLLAVCEHYDIDSEDKLILELETLNEKDIFYNEIYKDVTGESPKEFAESFMDNYFLGGDEVWCSLSTKLQDYMM